MPIPTAPPEAGRPCWREDERSLVRGRTGRATFLAALLLTLAGLEAPARARAGDAPAIVPGAPNLQLPPPPPGPASPPAPPPQPATSGGGDAEPAPGESAPPPTTGAPVLSDTPAHGGRHQLAFGARFAYRLGDAGQAISPAAGYGVVGGYSFTYVRVGDAVDLSLGVDFSSDRFATGEEGMGGNGAAVVSYSSTRVLSENDFLLEQTFALAAGAVRPFATLGIGVGIGSFESVAPQFRSPDSSKGSETDAHALGRAALGLDVPAGSGWAVRLRGNYTAVRRAAPFVTATGQTLPLFGDLLDIDVQAVYRF